MRWQRTAAALVLVAGSLPAEGQQPAVAVPQEVAKLQAWIDGTRDLACRFEQTLVSGALGADVKETGKLWLSRPGRIRWDYLDPEKKTALLLGDRTLLYLPDDRQLVEGKLEPDQSALPELLAGKRRIAEAFETFVAPPGPNGVVRLRLVPKARPEAMTEVVLQLRPPEYAIEGAEVTDGMGNHTAYRFTSVRRNLGVDEALFRFQPPAGTTIVSQ
jgi:outer membrane lipoprotein carrier protein